MKTPNQKTVSQKSEARTDAKVSRDDHQPANRRDEFAVYCHLLHGWFKQPERFEQFASRCADLAKVAVAVARKNGIA